MHIGLFRRTTGRCICAATIVASACALMASANPAHALTYGLSPWLVCANNKEAAEVAVRNMPLEPASGATVSAGVPIVFSGESNHALTFSVASSSALLSTPDVDSGVGAQSGAFYRFTSTKASATPRTMYWTASFTFTPEDCESPSTFTTPVRTLVVAPSEAEVAAAKKQQEEEAAKKKQEEGAVAKKKQEEAAATGSVVLEGLTADIERGRDAEIKITCSDVAPCAGRVMLTAGATISKGKGRHIKSESIGISSFSIGAGEEATVKIPLDTTGRALLAAAHGHLNATLTILRTSPPPSKTRSQHIYLDLQATKTR